VRWFRQQWDDFVNNEMISSAMKWFIINIMIWYYEIEQRFRVRINVNRFEIREIHNHHLQISLSRNQFSRKKRQTRMSRKRRFEARNESSRHLAIFVSTSNKSAELKIIRVNALVGSPLLRGWHYSHSTSRCSEHALYTIVVSWNGTIS
jgi:hypothetical protein